VKSADRAAAPLLGAARAALLLPDGGGTRSLELARERLLRWRLLRPDEPAPPELKPALRRLGRSKDPAIANAARPWTNLYIAEFEFEPAMVDALIDEPPSPSPGGKRPERWEAVMRNVQFATRNGARWRERAALAEWVVLRPDLPFLWSDLKRATENLGRSVEALRIAEVLFAREDSFLTNQGLLTPLVEVGRFAEAVRHLRRMIEIEDSNGAYDPWLRFSYAKALVDYGSPAEASEAIRIFDEIVKKEPAFPGMFGLKRLRDLAAARSRR
jgi:tetratricopeptide (TPR) repeat protein